ncbi:MAG TPA: methyltransferase domain-containing protein [Nitrospiria bacterium]|nr:methyltransferase domain-containing protein [Nitrospiria bacterium]
MRILYIWDADYPWDVRVEKICKTLRDNGHEVHIAARNLKKRPVYENVDGLHVHRLKAWKNNALNYVFSFPLFISPIWRRFLRDIIQNNSIKLIMVRDLPLAVAGIWAGRRYQIPVIFDMAEDYVSMIRDIWKDEKVKIINLVVRNPYLAHWVERYALKRMDHILVVVEEAKEIVRHGGGSLEKTTVVSNTPTLSIFKNRTIQMNDELKLIEGRFSAIYTGGIQLVRGIQLVMEAIPEVVKTIPDFLFVVVGDGVAAEQLKGIIHDKQLQDHVLWIGWVDHERLLDYIRVSKIGLIPHFVTDHVNTTIPNKLFDYMGCGLPVIASDSIPMKRVIKETRCGEIFKSGDSKDLARAILKIDQSDSDHGRNGIEAIKRIYNWETDSKNLISVVEKSSMNERQNVRNYFDRVSDDYLRYKYSPKRRSYMSVRQEKMLYFIDKYLDRKKKKVLDAGCGPGLLAMKLQEKGYDVTGIDLSKEMLALASKQFSKSNSSKTIPFLAADIENIPFIDNCFDMVSTAGVIEYLAGDDVVLREFRRVLKNDGLLLISVTNKYSFNLFFDNFFEVLGKNAYLFSIMNWVRKIMGIGRMERKMFEIRKHAPALFKEKLLENDFYIMDSTYFYFSLLPHPFDIFFPRFFEARVGNALERLGRTKLGCLGEGYLLMCRNTKQP